MLPLRLGAFCVVFAILVVGASEARGASCNQAGSWRGAEASLTRIYLRAKARNPSEGWKVTHLVFDARPVNDDSVRIDSEHVDADLTLTGKHQLLWEDLGLRFSPKTNAAQATLNVYKITFEASDGLGVLCYARFLGRQDAVIRKEAKFHSFECTSGDKVSVSCERNYDSYDKSFRVNMILEDRP
jgi:hypothetical protein